MGQLRDKMYQDLRLRGYRLRTTQQYLRWAERYAAYFHRSPERMGEGEIRTFLMHLLEQRAASPATHKMAVAALRFLYGVAARAARGGGTNCEGGQGAMPGSSG